MRAISVIVALLFAISAVRTSACLAFFAGVGEPADPVALVVQTYERLLSEVTGPLSPDVVRKIIDGGKPFEIPEGVELDGLRKHMKDFAELVRKRDWEARSVPALLKWLEERSQQLEKGDEQREAAQRANRADVVIAFPVSNRAILSPDGRYAVSSNMPTGVKDGVPWTLNLHDFQTNETTTVPGGKGYHWGPFFSADGTALLFAGKGRFLTRVPFEDGKPDWTRAKRLGDPEGDAVFGRVRAGKSPKFVYASDENEGIWRFHIETGKRVKADLDPVLERRQLVYWSVSPGTDRLELVFRTPTNALQLHLAEMKKDGRVELLDKDKYSQYISTDGRNKAVKPVSVARSNNGKSLILLGEQGSMLYLLGKDKVRPDVLYDGTSGPAAVRTVLKHPTLNEVVAVFQDSAEDRYWANVFDAKTGKLKGHVPLPPVTFDVKFSADGKQLIAITNDGKIGVLNYYVRGPR